MGVQSSNVGFGDTSGSGGPLEPIPFRLLAVADFSREGRGLGDSADAETHRVDKDNFDALLAKMNPKLIFEVPNKLLKDTKDVLVDIDFKSLKDFEGPAVAKRVAPCAALEELRAQINEHAANETTADGMAAKIREIAGESPLAKELITSIRTGGPSQPAAPPKSEPKPEAKTSGGVVDAILSMVDDGESEEKPKESPALGSILSSVTSSARTTAAPSKQAQGVLAEVNAWIDKKIGEQLDPVLHHPDFQSVESAWRGLRFLIERTDFRKDIVVEILAARKGDLRKFLVGGVLQNEYDMPGNPPLGAVICDSAFDTTPPDLELLQEIAGKCELIQAPFIGQAGAAFFGRQTLHGVGLTGSLAELLAGAQFTKWKSLREKDEMRWAALTLNRILLRAPHAANPGKSYPETVNANKGEGLLFGGTVWALGACMTQSFAKEGWPHSISGLRGGGAVTGLPLRAFEGRPGRVQQIPLETMLTEANTQELSSAGLIPLQCPDNSDTAFFTYLPCVSAPKRFSNPAATQEAAMHTVLPYQLFASRMAIWLQRFLGEARGSSSAQEMEAGLKAKLAAVLGTPKTEGGLPSIRVEVSDHDQNPELYQVCLEIKPDFKFFGLTPRIQLAIAVRR